MLFRRKLRGHECGRMPLRKRASTFHVVSANESQNASRLETQFPTQSSCTAQHRPAYEMVCGCVNMRATLPLNNMKRAVATRSIRHRKIAWQRVYESIYRHWIVYSTRYRSEGRQQPTSRRIFATNKRNEKKTNITNGNDHVGVHETKCYKIPEKKIRHTNEQNILNDCWLLHTRLAGFLSLFLFVCLRAHAFTQTRIKCVSFSTDTDTTTTIGSQVSTHFRYRFRYQFKFSVLHVVYVFVCDCLSRLSRRPNIL